MAMSILDGFNCSRTRYERLCHAPFKYLSDVGQMHLNAMLVLVSSKRHVTEFARGSQFRDRYAGQLTSANRILQNTVHSLSRSNGKFPIGV
jgi:hypothetical protein